MATLERAIQIAVKAHSGQTDKSGEPYILHPFRVMFAVPDTDARIVAVLHDVVEVFHHHLDDRLQSARHSRGGAARDQDEQQHETQ